MDKISERRQLQSAAKGAGAGDDRDLWIVLGAGRLGRGFLNLVAGDQAFRSLLVVEGVNTTEEDVEELNGLLQSGAGYSVVVAQSSERTHLLNYTFTTALDTGAIIAQIADPATRIISTSVGLDRLLEVTGIVASGLSRRVTDRMPPILMLVCENGRSEDGLIPSEIFKRELEKSIPPQVLEQAAILPRVVTDCAVPALPRPATPILIGEGTLWIENLQSVTTFLKPSRHVKLADPADMAILHTRKLYGYNALHCIISVLGHFADEPNVDIIAREPGLHIQLEKIVEGLVGAICHRHSIDPASTLGGQTVRDYVREALGRLQRPLGDFDLTERAMKRIGSGWYLRDGRLEGPIVDLGLLDKPWLCVQLVHALALCLYCFVRNLDTLRGDLPWLSVSRPSRRRDGLGSTSITSEQFHEQSIFHPAKTSHALMEVLAEDFRVLNKWTGSRWPTREISRFLDRPISAEMRVAPKSVAALSCVVFDLDEGLVATESLLYLVTRDLVAKYSKNGRTISHDEYARHVGTSEIAFFQEMIREFQIRGITADALVKERENLYHVRLEGTVPESLVKPGFKEILQLLANQKAKMAVASNASERRVEATLDHVGIANYFAACRSPSRGLREKPAADMIDAILSEFGEDAQRCVVVESSVTGVEAARRAGCYCILLVNDYTSPEPMERRGVEVLSNSQALLLWFKTFFAAQRIASDSA
jgi:putative hydrolase of the HAD superfamily